MASRSIFNKPFDEGTLSKLEIFENYFREWLPVFVSPQKVYWENIQIFDFFSGAGRDCNNVQGSPLIILKVINEYASFINSKKLKVRIVLNELNVDYHAALLKNIQEFELVANVNVEIFNLPFAVVFENEFSKMANSANFLFLDQNGIKEITSDVFKRITSLKTTDFLFFISSSFFKRFSDTPEFSSYFPFTRDEIVNTDFYHIHRKVLGYYKSLIPVDKAYYLAPFSIKKIKNIYGLIFGTNHTFGIEKFLNVAWKLDKLRGEANYDIDNEKISTNAPFLFEELSKPTKRQLFEENFEKLIINGTLKSNTEAYSFALNEGFQLKDANQVLRKLIKSKKISLNSSLINEKLHKCLSENIVVL